MKLTSQHLRLQTRIHQSLSRSQEQAAVLAVQKQLTSCCPEEKDWDRPTEGGGGPGGAGGNLPAGVK